MAKRKQVIPIPMTKGLEQGDSPLLSQQGLLRLENGVFEKAGQISKCTGMETIGDSTYDEDCMVTLQDRPVLLDADRVLAHEGATLAEGTFEQADTLHVSRHTISELGGTRQVKNVTMAESDYVRVVCYTDTETGGSEINTYKVYSVASGRLISEGTYSSGGIRVVSTVPRLVILARNNLTSKIAVATVDKNTGAVGAFADIGVTANVQSTFKFDACPVGGANDAILMVYETAAGQAHVVTLDDDDTAHGPTTTVLISARSMACYQQQDGFAICLFSDDTGGSSNFVVYAECFDALAARDASATVFSHASDRPTTLCGAPLTATTGMVYIGVLRSTGGLNPQKIHRVHLTADCAGGASSGTGNDLMWGMTPFSAPMVDSANRHYLTMQVASDDTPDQDGFIVVRSDGNAGGDPLNGEVQAHFAKGYGGHPRTGLAGGEMAGSVVDVGDGVFRLVLTRKLSDEQAGAALVEIDLEPSEIMAVDADDRVLIEGSVGYEYDGFEAYESGFLLYPTGIGVTEDTSTAGPPAGDYSYCATYSFMDSKGCIHRSVPGPVEDLTATTAFQKIVIVPSVGAHRKAIEGKVLIEVWRTKKSGSFFYKAGEVENAPSSSYVTYNDTVLDAVLVTNESLYKQPAGPVLSYQSPQPWKVCCMHQKRHFIVDMERPQTRVLYSNIKVPRAGYEWNDGLSIDVPHEGGDITALASYVDRLLIFKSDRIYSVYGKGYTFAGTGSGYSDPIAIPGAVGCTVQKSVVESPSGLMFKARSLLWGISPQFKLSPVGDSVEFFTDNNTVRRGLVVPEKDYIVFITSGNALVYHYLAGAWSEFTWDAGIDGCVSFGGLLAYSRAVSGAATVACEKRSVYTYLDAAYGMVLETGWISPANAAGWGRAYSIMVGGHLEDKCTLRCKVAYDGSPHWADNQTYVTDGKLLESGVDSQYGTGLSSAYADNAMFVDYALSQQKITSLRVHIAEETSLPYAQWEDTFSDGVIGSGWLTVEDEGTVTEVGGELENKSDHSAGDYPLWNGPSPPNLVPVAAYYSLEDMGVAGDFLFMLESELDIATTFVWCDHGMGIMQDLSNAECVEVGSDGGPGLNEARRTSVAALVFTNSARDGGGSTVAPVLRIYWNKTADAKTIVNSDSLAAGNIAAYVSRDSGTTWTEVGSASSLTVSDAYVILYSRVMQPGISIETNFKYATLTRYVEPTRGVTIDLLGLEVATGRGMMRVGDRRKS